MTMKDDDDENNERLAQEQEHITESEPHVIGMDQPTPENDPIGRFRTNPAITAADLAVIHAAKTGEGCIPITSIEQLQALADMAQARMQEFETRFETMTPDQATFVRQLRCDQGYTWRAVAEACALEWYGDWGSNQLAGIAICERAAQLLQEDPGAAPWN